MAALQEFLGGLSVVCRKFGLEIRSFVPGDSQPGQAVEDAVDGFLGGTFGVGILDAQHQFTVMFFCVQPVVDGGAGAADMEVAGWAGGKRKRTSDIVCSLRWCNGDHGFSYNAKFVAVYSLFCAVIQYVRRGYL